MSLEDSICHVSQLIGNFVDHLLKNNASRELPIDLPVPDTETIDRFKEELSATISRSLDPNLFAASSEGTSEETLTALTDFNDSVGQQSREFTSSMGFTQYADSVLHQVRENSTTESELATIKNVTIHASQVTPIAQLCALLDLLMATSTDENFASLRPGFYTVLQHISESLATVSSETISVFWYFVESRAQRMKETIFNSEVTSNRIAILSLCNSLTDKFYTRKSSGKLDSYAKDTFNDVLQARVRTFLTTLLNFDDSTGLNKYFSLANRENREPSFKTVKTGDDQLLEDVLSFYRLLRDPYTYLKNPRQLAAQADSLVKLHSYLMDEETKYSKVHPARDIYLVKPPFSEQKKEHLAKKYATMEFFPEQYWLSPFEDTQSENYEKIKAEDQRRASKRFDSSKFRKLLILQIYLVSCFFVEFQGSRKRNMLKKIKALPSTKHITEESTPDVLVPTFLKIKRETVRLVKAWDPQWSFMLQRLSASEEHWWEWIIYGKSENGKSLLASRTITDSQITETKELFGSVYPEKSKRYFNTHATPQLSRRMKTKTGLALLARDGSLKENYAEKIAALTEVIENEADKQKKVELAEERTVLIWKHTRALRDGLWLGLDKELNTADLENEEEEDEEEEEEILAQSAEKEEKEETEAKEDTNTISESSEVQENGQEEPTNGATAHGASATRESANAESSTCGNGTLNTPSADSESVGEITGDQVAESRARQLSENSEKSVGEVAGEAVAQTRKRERSPENDDGASAKRTRTGPGPE